MESRLKPKIVRKYDRRLPKAQQSSVTCFDDIVVAIPASSSVSEGNKIMESRLKPKIVRKYGRRLPKPQRRAVTCFDDVVAAIPASSVGPVGYGIAEQNQHLAVYHHSHLKLEGVQAEPSSIFHCFPRSRRSKRRDLQKKMTKVVESADQKEGNMVERKSKGKADSSDSENYTPRVRGLLPGSNLHRRGTRKRKEKAYSSDSENYTPRLRVRGQRRGLLHCSNSITHQGMLDSKMFELYFENIWGGISEEKRKSFAYLDSMWFNLYTKSSFKEKVLNWIKKKDIFSKKYVLIPIVLWSHWSLLILCHFGEESKSRSPCMVLLDSLQSANQSLEPQIRKFILDIHKMEERPANRESLQKIPFLVPKVPQQRNGEECGCYVLFYVHLFLENAPESFSISQGYPYFMKEDWFTVQSLDNFRDRLGSVPVESSSSDA